MRRFPLQLLTKEGRMKRSLVLLPAMIIVSACATTGTVTAEERARCQEMVRNMGVAAPHDHQAERSGMASPMNGRHDRCRAIARQDAATPAH
jgi:hypothetical protein